MAHFSSINPNIHKIWIPLICIPSWFKIPYICLLFGNTRLRQKFCNNYNKRCFIIKAPPTSRNVTLSWHAGKECNRSTGLYVAIYSSPWKTYLPGQPLHHTVHVYTIQSKHLLKETHSPTYTVNFCKYYKGNLLLSGTFPANFPRGISRLICCFWLHFPWNSNSTYRLAYCDLCWQQSYGTLSKGLVSPFPEKSLTSHYTKFL